MVHWCSLSPSQFASPHPPPPFPIPHGGQAQMALPVATTLHRQAGSRPHASLDCSGIAHTCLTACLWHFQASVSDTHLPRSTIRLPSKSMIWLLSRSTSSRMQRGDSQLSGLHSMNCVCDLQCPPLPICDSNEITLWRQNITEQKLPFLSHWVQNRNPEKYISLPEIVHQLQRECPQTIALWRNTLAWINRFNYDIAPNIFCE